MRILKWLAAVAVLYTLYAVAFFFVMRQAPEKFTSVVAGLPMPIMMTVPFETLWNVARAGSLSIGSPAPDFQLETYDRKSRVRLSAQLANKPVVLVFGSYT